MMISSIRLAENDDSNAFDSIIHIGDLLGCNENFIVRASKCRSDDKYHKTNLNR